MAAARLARPPGADGRPGSRAAAGRAVRPGLDPLHRPHPRGDHHAVDQRGHGGPRRPAVGLLRARPRAALRRRRPGLPPCPRHLRVGTPPPAVGHPGRRADAGGRRRAARDRAGGASWSPGSRSTSSAPSRRASDGARDRRGRPRASLRRAHPPRAAALVVAPAHLDAYRPGAAAPAGPGGRPGLGHPAAGRRLHQDLPVAGRPPGRSRRSTNGSASSTSTPRRGSPRSTCC